MRRGIEAVLRRMWRGEPGLGTGLTAVLTAPPSVLFGAAVRLRGFLYDREILRSQSPRIPVVSVGNLAVGGTGKTPVASWVLDVLQGAGWHPALVLRGVGEDEVRLHALWHPHIQVVQGAHRAESVERARVAGADIAVLDDGFQHRRLRRDLDIVLLSPEHPLPPKLLPRGPFREPLRALSRADLILVTAKGECEMEAGRRLVQALAPMIPKTPVHLFPFEIGAWCRVDGVPAPPPPGVPIVVTSVASPEPFLRSVEKIQGTPLRHLAFPDHHSYDATDAAEIRSAARAGWVATTEKDAVKLARLTELLPELRVLPLIPTPSDGLAELLLGSLDGAPPPGIPR